MKKILLIILLLTSLVVKSQVFNYTKITDHKSECICNTTILIMDSVVSISVKDSTKVFKIKDMVHITDRNIYKISVVDNSIDRLTICYGIAIINYIDPKRKEVQFLNIK